MKREAKPKKKKTIDEIMDKVKVYDLKIKPGDLVTWFDADGVPHREPAC